MQKISRREFLKISGATAAGATLLGTGCTPATPATTATPTPAPTLPPVPATTFVSKVVQVRHAGVWAEKALVPEALGQMLDRAVVDLTGAADAGAAWKSLFQPTEKIAIKVNAFRNSIIWTHVPLVTAVTDRLVAAGVPAEQILIFDCLSSELTHAGFTVNPDGPGIRCTGNDGKYSQSLDIPSGGPVKLSDHILACDALINMPVLKSHMISGLTFALKNHYGSVDRPDSIHDTDRCIPALNEAAPIKDKTRLVIGDMLEACLEYSSSFPYWKADYTGDSILMSTDPVAADAVALEWISQLMKENGVRGGFALAWAKPWLDNAQEKGLGTSDLTKIDWATVQL
jgi:hypothetical protein